MLNIPRPQGELVDEGRMVLCCYEVCTARTITNQPARKNHFYIFTQIFNVTEIKVKTKTGL
jgi:hypothetical protein